MKAFIAGTILVLLTAGLYLNTLGNGFVNFDDPALLYDNPQVLDYNFAEAFTSVVAEDYIPLVTTSFAAEYALFGLDPFYFHLGNLLLHSLCVGLIFYFIFLFSGSIYVGAVTAVLFAVHPLHVESVAWLAERKDVLSTFFFVAGMIFYWYFLRKKSGWLVYLLTLVCFVLALFAKFMAISLPAILILMHLQKRTPFKKIVLLQIPFAIVAAVFTYIHLLLHNRGQHLEHGEDSFWAALLRGADSLAFYMHKMVIPTGLSAYYEKGVAIASYSEYAALIAFVGLFGFLAWKNRVVRGACLFGGTFFLLTIFPVLQIVSFGNKFAFADRFMYLPSIGLFFMIAVALSEYFDQRRQWLKFGARAVGIGVCAALAFLTFERNQVWASSETLWANEVESYPQSSVANNNLGSLYLDQGRYELALKHLQASAELKPNYIDPHINLGLLYLDQNRLNEALREMNQAIKIDPRSPTANLNLGVIHEKLGQGELAFKHYDLAVSLDPELSIARHNLGVMYYRQKNMPKALELFRETIRRNPRMPETFHNIGVVLVETGQDQLAIESFQKATQLEPLYEEPHMQLLQIYQRLKIQDKAAEEVRLIQRIQDQKKALGGQRTRPRRIK